MSYYTPDNQILGDSIEALIRAMDDLDERMLARIDETERQWKVEHLEELAKFRGDFAALHMRLRTLQRSTR